MDAKVTNAVKETLENAQYISRSLSCRLITMEGPWHLCNCEKPKHFVFIYSKQALIYLMRHSKIHVLNDEGLKQLGLSYPSSSNVVYVPLSYEEMNLGVMLIELKQSEANTKVDLPFFHALSLMSASAIGNALKVCLFSRLEKVSQLFMEEMELDDRLQKIVDATRSVYGKDFHSEIFLYDPIEKKLNLKASTLVEADQYDTYRMAADVGWNGWVLEHQKTKKILNAPNDSRAIQEHV